jgi:4-aminobutyrate aminotransferase
MQNAADIGGYIMERLREMQNRHEVMAQVRGLGLMIGIEISRDKEMIQPDGKLRDQIVLECFSRGLVLQGAGESAIRFSPPLIIDREQADFALDVLDASIVQSLK